MSPETDENMPIPAKNPPQLSVHIMLPEAVDRRLARWTNKLAGASWPAWGGHVTLVPHFVEKGEAGMVQATLLSVCADEEPFSLRFGAPIAVPDVTRPDYFAVFVTVDSSDADAMPPAPKLDEHAGNAPSSVSGNAEDMPDVQLSYLHRLRQRLLDALAPFREDIYPQLLEQRFLPHVTLALGLGELEAQKLVREIRAEPLAMSFRVEVLWLVTQTFGEGAHFGREPIPLGSVAPVEIMRD